MTEFFKALATFHFVPFQFFFLGLFLLAALIVARSKPTIQDMIMAVNSVGSQPTAIIVLVIGCIMLIESKQYGLDATVAGTIIGYGGNMLQSQLKDATHPPPGSAVKTQMSTEFTTPSDAGAVNVTVDSTAAGKDTKPAQPTGRAYQNVNPPK